MNPQLLAATVALGLALRERITPPTSMATTEFQTVIGYRRSVP